MTNAKCVLPLVVIFPLLVQVEPAPATEYPSSDWISDGLQSLPFVKTVVVAGPKHVTKTILHIRDWHFLPRDAFAASVRSVNSEVSDATLDDLYRDFLREVELVQAEQIALLRFLIKHHGLRQVYSEGLTKRDMPIFVAKIRSMSEVQTEMPEYRKQLAETRQRLKELRSEDETDADEYRLNKKLAAGIKGLMHQHRLDRLRVGAAGRLLMTGELVDVLPLEEEEFFTAANPEGEDRAVNIDATKNELREDAHVRNLLNGGSLVVVILGGAHDLSDNFARLAEGKYQYVTVTTEGFDRASEAEE